MARQLYLNGRFIGGGTTAVNAVAHALTSALCAADTPDWDISVAVPESLQEAAAAQGWPVTVIGQRNGILWEQLELPRLRKQGVIAGFFNTVPLWGRGYVTMVHDAHVFTTPQSYGRGTRIWRQILSRQAGRKGNAVVTVSSHSRDTLLHHHIGTAERIGVVPNGLGTVGTQAADVSIFDRLGVSQAGPFCVALASLLPHKNIGLLLRAFADEGLADVPLVLIGKADAAAFDAAGLDLPPSVVFAGYVSDGELAALYGNALAVCLPSTQEGFGLPALEAMALGAPALVSDCGALPEVVGRAGWVLPADDPSAWRGAILELMQDPSKGAGLIAAGHLRAQDFTWPEAAQSFLRHL
ncbi:MAG: glycosyltransferase family 1 protein, partial [Marinomonas sp.]